MDNLDFFLIFVIQIYYVAQRKCFNQIPNNQIIKFNVNNDDKHHGINKCVSKTILFYKATIKKKRNCLITFHKKKHIARIAFCFFSFINLTILSKQFLSYNQILFFHWLYIFPVKNMKNINENIFNWPVYFNQKKRKMKKMQSMQCCCCVY